MRGEMQAHVWSRCRSFRAEVPAVHLTCVDVPEHATLEQISTCLQPPMCNYRELAYYGGVWYVPETKQAPGLGEMMRENCREALFGPGAKQASSDGSSKPIFQQRAFPWRNPHKEADDLLCTITWTAIGTIHPDIAKEP